MLVDVVFPWEERLAPKQLRENTAYRPHVDGLCVRAASQHDLRRPVPPSDDVLCELQFGVLHSTRLCAAHNETM